jgi:hypothetical protein
VSGWRTEELDGSDRKDVAKGPAGDYWRTESSHYLPQVVRATSLAESEPGKLLLQALPLRGVFRFAKFTGKFEKLLCLLGLSDL